jgi:hypothetical protein
MKCSKNTLFYVLTVYVATLVVNADDTFNYDRTEGNNYGPEDWDRVSCDNLGDCVSRNQQSLS